MIVRSMRDGAFVPRQMYTSNEGKRLNASALHELLAQGVSIVVDGDHRSIPHIRQLAAAIEREMGIRTQVNAYMSFSKGAAFKPHWDGHDVLNLQVHGSKHWRVWKADLLHPLESRMFNRLKTTRAEGPPDQEIDLAPGDVLFIPRGEPHSAAVSVGSSVHLTIGLCTRTGIDFFDRIRDAAVDDPLLRMDLPRHSSAEQSHAHDVALKQAIRRLIDAASISQFLKSDDLSRTPALRTAVGGTLPRSDEILRLTLRRRVPLPDVEPGGGLQLVTIGNEPRRLSPGAIDALRWLVDHDQATLHSVYAGLASRYEPESMDAAIRELMRFGFLEVVRTA
jgi:hypothetical protein